MDITSGIVVVVLVLLSGFVAALGDWLGRKLGKKRLRFGRLRPKHTAVAGTAIAGMVITIVTISALSVVSAPVRKWLIDGAKVQAQLQDANAQLDMTRGQVDAAHEHVRDVQAQLTEEQRKLADEQKKVNDAAQTVAQLRGDAAKLRDQVVEFTRRLTKSSQDLEALRAEYDKLQAERTRLEGDINTYNAQLRDLNDFNRTLQITNDQLEVDIARMQEEVKRLTQSVADAEQMQQIATQQFETERKRIESDRAKALADLRDAETRLKSARDTLADLQRSVIALQGDNTVARMSPLIYNRNDELSRLAVRSGLSQAEARSYLLTVLETASRDALARGASEAPTGRSTVAFPGLQNRDGTVLTPEAQFQQTMLSIAAKEMDQLVVVRARFNAFMDEWVPIRVDVVPNPVVYHEGDFIIETRVDGKKGVQAVTEAVVSFMAAQLRDRAEQDGMVPATGQRLELGEISQEELQQIVADIVATDRTISVRFHAAQDTRAGDRLRLDVRLR